MEKHTGRRSRLLFVTAMAAVVAAIAAIARCEATTAPGAGEGDDGGSRGPGGGGTFARRGFLPAGGPPSLDLRRVTHAAVAGTVRARGGAPIEGAQVCAWASSPLLDREETRRPRCAQTGADGRYRIADLPPARTRVEASARGFIPGRHSPGGSPQGPDHVALVAGMSLQGVDITLDGGGVEVHGVVKDLSGGEIAGADVRLGAAFGQSGDDGSFTLWTAPGQVWVQTEAEGYAPGQDGGVVPGHEFEIFMTPEAVLIGQVVRASDGTPIAGARVAAAEERWGSSDGHVLSGADGRFRIDRLKPGVYKASAEADDAYGSADAQVLLGIGETAGPLVIRAHPAFMVEGRVEVAGGGACELGTLQARDPASGQSGSAPIEAGGEVRLRGLLAGSYEVMIHCKDHVAAERYEPLVIEDRSREGLRWLVEPGQAIRGVVVDARGAPVPRVSVHASPKVDPGAPRARQTHGWGLESAFDGSFALTGLLPGVYEVNLSPWGSSRPPLAEPVEVTLPEREDVEGLRIELPAAGELRGRVSDPQGRGLARVRIALSGAQRSPGTETADDGTFHLPHVAPGEYRVQASRHLQTLRAPGSGDDDVQGARVEIRADEVSTLDLVVEPANGRISGVVRDEDGGPVADAFIESMREPESAAAAAGASVRSVRWASYFAQPLLSDADGRFTLEGLAPGKHALRAHRKGGGEAILEHVELGDDVTLTIAATATLAGRVVSGGGAPERFAIEVEERATGFERRDEFFRTEGAWSLPELPAGEYTVRAVTTTGTAESHVTMEAGRDAAGVILELTPRVTARGRVVDLDGAPVPGMRVSISGVGGAITFALGEGDKKDVSDAEGRFEVERAPTGVVQVSIVPEVLGGDFAWTRVPTRIAADAPVVELSPIQIARARVANGARGGDLGFVLKQSDVDADPLERRLEVAVVRPGGPAAHAGLRVGDVITSVDGRAVTGERAYLYTGLTRIAPGASLRLGLERGVAVEVTATPPP